MKHREGQLHGFVALHTLDGTFLADGDLFRFVSDHVVQKGPAFKTPIESTIAANGQVQVRYADDDGKEQIIEERLELPNDVANGMILAVNVPGVTGAVASLLGKTPPDSHVWVLAGDAPALVKAEMPLSAGGPMWRLGLVSPVWPPAPASPPTKVADEAKGSKELEN